MLIGVLDRVQKQAECMHHVVSESYELDAKIDCLRAKIQEAIEETLHDATWVEVIEEGFVERRSQKSQRPNYWIFGYVGYQGSVCFLNSDLNPPWHGPSNYSARHSAAKDRVS